MRRAVCGVVAGCVMGAFAAVGHGQCCEQITAEHVFLVEDTQGLTPINGHVPFSLVEDAFAQIKTQYGDRFDFVLTSHTHGTQTFAFHSKLRTREQFIGLSILGDRFMVARMDTERLKSRIAMGVLSGFGTPVNTMMHEYLHMWAMYLPPFAAGKSFQGGGNFCGGEAHPNGAADLNGGIFGSDWVVQGGGYAERDNDGINSDTGGLMTGLDLYLAGWISGAELDALVADRWYMDEYDQLTGGGCDGRYDGPVTVWSSQDIIDSVGGERKPGPDLSQKDFRTAWVFVYQPGELGTQAFNQELAKVVEQANLFAAEWANSSMGHSTMSFKLFEDCDCDGVAEVWDCNANGVDDAVEIAGGQAEDCNGNGIPDGCELDALDCNGNGRPDSCDMADGYTDCNFNGILDVCEYQGDVNNNGRPDTCEAWLCACDMDADGDTDFFDLLGFLDAWFVGERLANFDGDGEIDFFDLLAFLDCWFGSSGGSGC